MFCDDAPDIPYGRPAPWVGNGVLPQVVQHRNVLIALHRVRPVPIYDQPPWYGEERVHAYVPRGAFAEWTMQKVHGTATFELRGHAGVTGAPARLAPNRFSKHVGFRCAFTFKGD